MVSSTRELEIFQKSSCLHLRQDFKHVSLNLRPVMAKKNPAFEDPHQFEAYLEKSGLECKEYKTCTKWFINYAQKPLH